MAKGGNSGPKPIFMPEVDDALLICTRKMGVNLEQHGATNNDTLRINMTREMGLRASKEAVLPPSK